MRRADSEFNRPVYAVSHATTTNQYVHARRRASKVCPNSATSRQCEEQDSNLHALRTLEPKSSASANSATLARVVAPER